MNVMSSSPRLGPGVKTSGSARRRCMFPSPGTPNYHHPASFGGQKGWSSERVPLHTNSNRSTLVPYNNGKMLPSKWEDAERWIISPVAGDNGLKASVQQQNRPKSKSGPLGPHGSADNPMYSPAGANCERRNAGSFVTESPLLNGVNADYNSLIQYQNGFENSENFSSLMDHFISRSVSLHGCNELLSHSSLRITRGILTYTCVFKARYVHYYGPKIYKKKKGSKNIDIYVYIRICLNDVYRNLRIICV